MTLPARRTIERRGPLTEAEFRRDYLDPGRPVILTGRPFGWAEGWTLEGLKARYGDRPISAMGRFEQRAVPEEVERTVAQLIDNVRSGSLELRLRNMLQAIPELEQAYEAGAPWKGLFRESRLQHVLWLQPAGNRSTFHHDASLDNLNVHIVGQKQWLLADPGQYRHLSVAGFGKSPIDPFQPDPQRFPDFEQAQLWEGAVRSGEVLFVPRYWWHCVLTQEPSINVNTFAQHVGVPGAWRSTAGVPLSARLVLAAASRNPSLGFRQERGLKASAQRLARRFLWKA